MDIAYTSSEEIGEENTMVVHPLTRLIGEVNILKKGLDDARYNVMIPKAKLQMKTGITGENSLRDKPNGSA